MLTTNTLIPLRITEKKKSRVAGKFQTIMFYDVENQRMCKTHLVTTYGNYNRWAKVAKYNYDLDTSILQGSFRYKDTDVIDADCRFTMHPNVSFDDAFEIIEKNS